MNHEGNTIPMFSLSPESLTLYSVSENFYKSGLRMGNDNPPPADNKPKPNLSDKAKRRMRKAVSYMVYLSHEKQFNHSKGSKKATFKLNFITLTLPSKQIHSDNQIKSDCLNHFFVSLKRKYNVERYVWKAEKQKNGNIHFHITTDKYINWRWLRSEWNRIINKLGYVDRFYEKHGSADPNSTDVHSIRKVKKISAYLSKYIVKDDKNGTVEGRKWGLSQSLSKIKSHSDVFAGFIQEEVNKLINQFSHYMAESKYRTTFYFSSDCLTFQNFPNLFLHLRVKALDFSNYKLPEPFTEIKPQLPAIAIRPVAQQLNFQF